MPARSRGPGAVQALHAFSWDRLTSLPPLDRSMDRCDQATPMAQCSQLWSEKTCDRRRDRSGERGLMFVWSQLAGMVCGRSLGWRVYIYYNAEILPHPRGTPGGKPQRLTARAKIARARPDRFWPGEALFDLSVCLCVCLSVVPERRPKFGSALGKSPAQKLWMRFRMALFL